VLLMSSLDELYDDFWFDTGGAVDHAVYVVNL
jgi:hypothetical protein